MKKALMIFGGLFLTIVILAVVGIAVLAVKGTGLDKESKAYVDQVVPVICADLRFETLLQYASKDLIASATPEEFEKVFNWFGKLGEFKGLKESMGQAHMSYTTQNGKSIVGKYVAQVDFENGPAQVQIVTVKSDEGWKIQMFRINPQALIE